MYVRTVNNERAKVQTVVLSGLQEHTALHRIGLLNTAQCWWSMYWICTLPRGGMYRKIHPPRPKRFPKGGDFAPRGPRDCPRAKPEGNLEGRGGCIFRYIPTRGSVRTFFHHYQGTIDFVAWQQMALASERLINSTYKHWSWLNQLLCCLAHLSH